MFQLVCLLSVVVTLVSAGIKPHGMGGPPPPAPLDLGPPPTPDIGSLPTLDIAPPLVGKKPPSLPKDGNTLLQFKLYLMSIFSCQRFICFVQKNRIITLTRTYTEYI